VSIISGEYGRGKYQAARPVCPAIVEAAAWVVVLLGVPVLLFELGERAARVLAIMAGAR